MAGVGLEPFRAVVCDQQHRHLLAVNCFPQQAEHSRFDVLVESIERLVQQEQKQRLSQRRPPFMPQLPAFGELTESLVPYMRIIKLVSGESMAKTMRIYPCEIPASAQAKYPPQDRGVTGLTYRRCRNLVRRLWSLLTPNNAPEPPPPACQRPLLHRPFAIPTVGVPRTAAPRLPTNLWSCRGTSCFRNSASTNRPAPSRPRHTTCLSPRDPATENPPSPIVISRTSNRPLGSNDADNVSRFPVRTM